MKIFSNYNLSYLENALPFFYTALQSESCHGSVALVSEVTTSSKRSLETLPDLLSMVVTPDEGQPLSLSLTRTRGLNFDDIEVHLDEPVAEEARGLQVDAKSVPVSIAFKLIFARKDPSRLRTVRCENDHAPTKPL